MDLGVIAIKGYSTLPKPLEQELHHQMEFSVIAKTLQFWERSYLSAEDTVSI